MTTILTPLDYPAIRAALDLSLDSASLPDSTIELPIFLGAADLEVKTRDPLWETRTGNELLQLTNAAIYLTAARIAPAMVRLLGETYSSGYRYQLQSTDWSARATELRGQADEALDTILDPGDSDSGRASHFGVASSRRGRW